MRRLTSRIVLGVAIIAACTGVATAELSVTVSITGNIDEVLPLLRHLQDLGIGLGAGAGAEPPKLEVHSVMSGAEPAEPAPPVLGFQQVVIEPASAKPGDSVLITARVGDPDHLVDTVAATVAGLTVDLFDNGTEGDATAIDGVWSRTVVVPVSVPAGDAALSISAFDVNGDAVQITAADGTKSPMTIPASVNIQAASEAPAPAPAPAQPVPAPAAEK
ncbi:MAG: hypothetical protein WC655_18075 [Candidatus Hydrogenedentales bacterium]|jgi:hypothetical protein